MEQPCWGEDGALLVFIPLERKTIATCPANGSEKGACHEGSISFHKPRYMSNTDDIQVVNRPRRSLRLRTSGEGPVSDPKSGFDSHGRNMDEVVFCY